MVGAVSEFVWDPESYLDLMAREVPDYRRLQDELVGVAAECDAARVLDLGIGSGVTACRVTGVLPEAQLVGVDDSAAMLAAAAQGLDPARTQLLHGRLQDPLPAGPFDLVVSMLAVHHIDGAGKADLFARIAGVLGGGGRFVLADLVIPDDPADQVTAIDGVMDTPSSLVEQLDWLRATGLAPQMRWSYRDLAVVSAGRAG